jgi:hypothetical protein
MNSEPAEKRTDLTQLYLSFFVHETKIIITINERRMK